MSSCCSCSLCRLTIGYYQKTYRHKEGSHRFELQFGQVKLTTWHHLVHIYEVWSVMSKCQSHCLKLAAWRPTCSDPFFFFFYFFVPALECRNRPMLPHISRPRSRSGMSQCPHPTSLINEQVRLFVVQLWLFGPCAGIHMLAKLSWPSFRGWPLYLPVCGLHFPEHSWATSCACTWPLSQTSFLHSFAPSMLLDFVSRGASCLEILF